MSKDSASSHNSKSQSAQNRQKNRRKNTGQKKPKKITESYLHNAGLYYLERFATSSGNFREVMMRKVKRSCMFHTEQDYDKCAQMVDALVEKFIRTELLNDTAYTRNMVQSLRRKGKSAKSIQLYLRGKKLDSALIISALEERDLETHETASEAELEAAMKFARKKRIGPFRGDKEEDIKKELGRLARAGFSYDTSRTVLNYDDQD